MKRAMVNRKEDNHGWEVNSGNVIGGLPDMKLDMEFSTAANLNYSVLQTGTNAKRSLQVHFSQGSV